MFIFLVFFLIIPEFNFTFLFFKKYLSRYFRSDELVLISLACSFIFLSYIVLFLGLSGLLYQKVILLTFLLGWLAVSFNIGCKFYKTSYNNAREKLFNFFKELKFKFASFSTLSLFHKLLILLLSSISILIVISWYPPPVGNDALAYHLYHPKIFVENHRIFYIPYTRSSLWPYFTEMLFTIGLLFKNEILAKFFHGVFAFLIALGIYCLGCRFFNKKIGFLAAVVFLLTPGIFMQSGYCYVDLTLTFYSFLTFYMIIVWLKKKEVLSLLLAGVFSGASLSIKYLGLITFVIAGGGIIYSVLREKQNIKKGLISFGIFLIVAALFSFIWYLRSFLITGNPFYPFFAKFFKGHGWYNFTGGIGKTLGFGKSIFSLFMLPWNITMFPGKFGGEQLGIAYLIFLPFMLFFIKTSSKITRIIIAISGIYFLIWFYLAQNLRFLFPILPFLSILVSIVFYHCYQKSKVAHLIISVVLFLNFSLAIYHSIDDFKFIFGILPREKYLLIKERSYRGWSYLNNLAGESDLILTTEPRLYYSKRPSVCLNTFVKSGNWPAEILKSAKYLMIHNSNTANNIGYLKYFPDRKLLFAYTFQEGNINYHYQIYKILQ